MASKLSKDFICNDWYIACPSQELKQKPIALTILNIPLILFRDSDGKPTALLDRCPHRNVPLSQGWVYNNYLICKYHGWRFDREGVCQEVPGLCEPKGDINRNATVYPVIEQNNFIWVYCQANEVPKTQPYQFPYINKPGFYSFTLPTQKTFASLENIAENFLDATHTHYVHTGLIRKNNHRQEITVKINRDGNMVEAIYLGEQKISGLIYQLLAPGCKEVTSIGRFILPSIAQLEYRTDRENYQLFISLFITPITDNLTKVFGVVTFRWGFLNWLGKAIAQPLFYLAAIQDKKILELQTANIKRFDGESFVYTEIDVMKPHITYLLSGRKSRFEKEIKIKL
jgi:phenylpropionate dioxygenase-like ring-hydroxylating dioxygenase large terminal subunit